MTSLQVVVGEIQERTAAAAVPTTMAFHPREPAAAAVAEEMQMGTSHRMVPVALAAVAMGMAAAAAAAVPIPVQRAGPEERVEQPPIRIPAAVVEPEEMMLVPVKSWDLLVVLPVALEAGVMEVQRVQHSPRLDREAEVMLVEPILAEPVLAVVAAAANMGLQI